MADISAWLRGFQQSRPSHSPAKVPEHANLGDSTQTTKEMARLRPGTRGSSFNLNASSFQDPISHARDLDSVWHNPNPDQLAETLKVVMMTQGCCQPVPVHYNACILHVLEAYHDKRLELASKTRQLEDAQTRVASVTKELQEKTIEWEKKEDNYKTELKNLEIMLAAGERGLELVTLARSKSALRHGRRASQADYQGNGQIDNTADSSVASGQIKGEKSESYDCSKRFFIPIILL
jgi:hypothetical protein